MSRTRTILGVAAASAAVLALAACSSGDSGSGSGEASGAADDYGLVSDGTLTVATEGTYRPFSFHEDGSGELVGYDVEIAEAVADKLGLEVEFQETQWDAIFAGLDAGRFDVIGNQVSITPEREEQYLFSEPYTVSRGVIVVNEGDSSISSFDDLDGKTTAQSLTSNWYELATESGAKVEAVEGWAQAVALLEQGRVDATINDELTFLDYLTTTPDAPIEVAAETDETSESAFAFTKDKEALVEAVDEALAELRDEGVLAEIGEKYFGADVSQ
ncbi:cystine transport system substrate-binding protein [Agromyces flavus]|uniref:Amino acid ABC transporter substrate-binding protein, PAAT family n=1 Tax=Agromyces flavus TaxID=589382 RepID=A0A1H1XAV9_9MICO|nr:amino acid ABC transporter substrate-binding protein [Agromyces flavus]MCP2366373.1 cystine transport system substrate-binding protein [Agromyces flavus]GGI44546.1 amino acid ABC transporter substrate-binding protein [Agromyces flavus]SDT06458.1 amino acid ABC transporter substrate-binding protein, PAAT family [Agromyces flavus]